MPTADTHTSVRHSNTIGILAMLASMAFFVANDTCVKLIGEKLPLGELILLRNTAATIYILAFAAVFGGLTLPVNPPKLLLGWRMVMEILSTLFFLSALIAMPIADATAIAQFTPLAMTAAAAVFLKEPVGWRRWLAALVGLIGVLLIARPGTSAFSPAAILLLIAVGFVVARDLLTRQISNAVPTLTLTLMSAAAVAPSGFLLLPFETWVWPQDPRNHSLARRRLVFDPRLRPDHRRHARGRRGGHFAVPVRGDPVCTGRLAGWSGAKSPTRCRCSASPL